MEVNIQDVADAIVEEALYGTDRLRIGAERYDYTYERMWGLSI